MQMDGAALFAAAHEANERLCGGRIERIAQPGRFDVVFTIRSGGVNHRLLFSADPESARVHLVGAADKGPDRPPTFLMMLRKHLLQARVTNISAPRMDRAVVLSVTATNDLGDRVQLQFVAECMGKHSNLILVGSDGMILDCAKRIPPAVSSLRTVLPGERYHAPPAQQKADALKMDARMMAAQLCDVASGDMPKALVSQFYGLSPFTAQHLCAAAGIEDARAPFSEQAAETAARALHQFVSALKRGDFSPSVQYDDLGAPIAFAPFALSGRGVARMATMGEAVSAYMDYHRTYRRLLSEKNTLTAAVNARLGKLLKRRAIQQDVLSQSGDHEALRLQGELMLAYAYQIKRGMAAVEVYDYTQDRPVTLKLDATKNAAENAALMFHRYRRKKSAVAAAQQQLDEILPEIDYWEGTLLSIEQADVQDTLTEIREELREQNLIRANAPKPGQRQVSRPLRFISPDGVEIFSGRNNAQNDQLTCRMARPNDTWLHAQGMAGSHVLVRANPVPPATLHAAAQIAAYFSRGKQSDNVPVDYTLIKNVRKPKGAKPGYVTYTAQKTLFVTPDATFVKSLIREQ
jgi:predicted ribosome quality control (RQC) complex YloA/Tae2 family protein